jgi:ParB-like chromosome segregation protein Spo0J
MPRKKPEQPQPRFATDVEIRDIEWLTANPENYRSHPPEQLEHLRQSIREFGVVRNVVARTDGVLIAGHGVVEAARLEGLKDISVHIFRGTEAQARKLMVADNELSRLAEDDSSQLAELLRAIEADTGLEGTGFDNDSLGDLLLSLESAAIPGESPEYDPEDMEFEHTCPKCGYEWSDPK